MNRGVEEVFVRESLERRLRSGQKLRVKLGIDPTRDKIHFGNAVLLWKLRAFQDLGHKVVLIVGDFTAQIGDPSDKLEKRPMLTATEISKNLAGFKKQVGKILDMGKTEVAYNSAWLSKLKFDEVCRLAESFSVQQMTNRRNFKDRIEQGVEISLREFMYPLMQGYDSVMVQADVEIGGFDQLFNLKAGRTIQRHYGKPEQDILVCKMLSGTDGRKMSKSWGNTINIDDSADEMFGKIMSLRDDLMKDYFLLCTDASTAEVEKVSHRLEGGENPRDLKLELAERIVTRYWGDAVAKKSRERFIEVFSQKKIPDDIESVSVNQGVRLGDLLLEKGIVKSKTDWRRLVLENAVTDTNTGETISDPNITATINRTLRVGKRRFVKIVLKG